MELQDNTQNQSEIFTKALWILIAISLSALEMLLPRIPLLPWLKPGFANVITIMWIIKYGVTDALLFSFLKSWITSFYFGFSFTSFLLSLGGGIFATIVMGNAWLLFGKQRILGTIGIGMVGALAHNCGQICIIYLTMARNSFIFYQLPFMCAASLVFGTAIGASVPFFIKLLNFDPNHLSNNKLQKNKSYSDMQRAGAIHGIFIFIFCISIIFIRNLLFLFISMLFFTAAVQFLTGFSVKKVFHPLKFWQFFIFIAIVYLFFSYGTKIHWIPVLTVEGVTETLLQFLRLWIWLEASLLLTHFRFHMFFFSLLKKLFPSGSTIFSAGLIALEYFPEMLQFSKSPESRAGLNFFRNPVKSLELYIRRHIEKIASDS